MCVPSAKGAAWCGSRKAKAKAKERKSKMKKTMIALCGALSLAAFAEPEAPEAGCACGQAKEAPKAEMRANREVKAPLVLNLDEGTTLDQIEAFKKDVLAKIDAAVAVKPEGCKCGKEGCKCPKAQKKVVVFVGDGAPGMGRRGMQGRPGMQGRQGMQGRRGMRRQMGAPAQAPEAPAAE